MNGMRTTSIHREAEAMQAPSIPAKKKKYIGLRDHRYMPFLMGLLAGAAA